MLSLLLFVAALAAPVAPATQPATRPAAAPPDLSRLPADRLRSYALGLWNRVAYLEQQLATERRTSESLRKDIATGDARYLELQKEVARLRVVEQEYRGTPAGQQAALFEAAILKKEPMRGMTLAQCERMFGQPYRQGINAGETTHKFIDGNFEHYCTFGADGKLISWYDLRIERPRAPLLKAGSNPDVYGN